MVNTSKWSIINILNSSYNYTGVISKGETITRANGNVLFFAGKRLQNVNV